MYINYNTYMVSVDLLISVNSVIDNNTFVVELSY